MNPLSGIRRQLAADDPAYARAQRGEPMADVERWVRAVERARAEGWHTERDLLSIDGLALVSSRTTEDVSHEVRVSANRVVSCTCDAGRAHIPCCHQAAVALHLWEQEMGADLTEVPARALALTLMRQYVGRPPAERGQNWGARITAEDGQPETRYSGPEPRGGEFL